MSEERTIGLVKAYGVKSNEVLVVTIPKEIRQKLGIQRGQKFLVKTDESGRIIYEPIK